MSRKKPLANGQNNGTKQNVFNGFVRHNLTAEEKLQYDQWSIPDEELWNTVERLVDSGYRLTLAHDNYNNTRQASLTCQNPKLNDNGWVLVARAPDPYNALCLLLFKHFHLLSEDWTAFHEREKGDSSWG